MSISLRWIQTAWLALVMRDGRSGSNNAAKCCVENKLNITSELDAIACCTHCVIFLLILMLLLFFFSFSLVPENLLLLLRAIEENVPKIFFIRHSSNWLVHAMRHKFRFFFLRLLAFLYSTGYMSERLHPLAYSRSGRFFPYWSREVVLSSST